MAEALTDDELTKVRSIITAFDGGQQISDLPQSTDGSVDNKVIEVLNTSTGESEYVGLVSAVKGVTSEDYPVKSFARVNGSADPAPSSSNIVGDASTLRSIAKHLKLGVVKDGVLVKECALGRLTKGIDGTAIAIDGTMGDVLVFTDCDIEFLKAHATVDGEEQNFIGLSLKKFQWNGYESKTFKPFAFTPDETIVCSVDGDTRSQAHSIYDASKVGSFTAPNTAAFTTQFRTSGAGLPTRYVSGASSIQQAQNKNTDALTNRPYMGGYYEFYEIIIALMFNECGTVADALEDVFGTGITPTTTPTASNFYSSDMAGNSGAVFIADDGTQTFLNIYGTNIGGASEHVADCFFGDEAGRYGCCEMLEGLRILDAITKSNLQGYVNKYTNIFTYDDNGNMTMSNDGSINPLTGDGMTTDKQYFTVRNVPNCEGLADGVMTAVINVYVRKECTDAVTIGTSAVIKYSIPVYRGFILPRKGCFRQLQGAHYLYGKDADGNVIHQFCCASSVDNIPAWQSFGTDNFYNTIDTDLAAMDGLDIIVDRSSLNGGWCSKADYGNSLFDATANGGAYNTYEAMFKWLKSCYGVGTNNQPANGYKSLNASVVGCGVNGASASARALGGSSALGHGNVYYGGAFAVPHLTLSSESTTEETA